MLRLHIHLTLLKCFIKTLKASIYATAYISLLYTPTPYLPFKNDLFYFFTLLLCALCLCSIPCFKLTEKDS